MVLYFCPQRGYRPHTLGDRKQVLVRPGLKPTTSGTEKQADSFSCLLLLSMVRLGSCQWYWVVTDAATAFDWSQMVQARPPNPM